MGYDRAITMFSPDGRLLQVEYAKKTVKQGSTAMGLLFKDGVALITDKRIVDKLIIAESVEKIFLIDDHIMASPSGILSDARVLIERAQLYAQQNRLTYESGIEVLNVVKDICNLKQICTQSGGLRPFGVSLLVAGIDRKGPSLFVTDPTGIYFQYKAAVIGEGENDIEEVLNKEYKQNFSKEDAIKLAMKALYKFLGKDLSADRIDVSFLTKDNPKIMFMPKEEVEGYIKEVKK
jgi:proteasome alpha subunit